MAIRSCAPETAVSSLRCPLCGGYMREPAHRYDGETEWWEYMCGSGHVTTVPFAACHRMTWRDRMVIADRAVMRTRSRR